MYSSIMLVFLLLNRLPNTQRMTLAPSTAMAGFFYVSQLAVKQMLLQQSGSIVNISTSLVDQLITGVPAALPSMTKAGLDAVTRGLAIEYGKQGIRINTVSPGAIDTPMHPPEAHEFLKGLHPVDRIGQMNEVIDAVLFLTDVTFTTGEVLHIDGGAHADRW
jgi:NAD(P)-dependent dehydrogenase (short-subunit alcohol dehydrogenase family)